MSVECTLSIGNAVINLAGVALGGVVGFLSARHISDRNAFALAGAKLRTAFAPSLTKLSLGRINKTYPDDIRHDEFLKNELPKIAEAIEEFKFWVSDHVRDSYEKAWKDYYQTIIEGGVASVIAYNESDPWSVVENKINKIRAFTKF